MKNKCLILSLLALCLTSCTNYPRDFVEFKNVVKNRQETATSLKDYKTVSWKYSEQNYLGYDNDYRNNVNIKPVNIECFNEYGEIEEEKITDYDKYYQGDKALVSLLSSWGGLYKEFRVYGNEEYDSLPFMTILENSYLKEATNRLFFFKEVVDDERIAKYEFSDLIYSTSDTGSSISIKDTKAQYEKIKQKFSYNLDNLLIKWEFEGKVVVDITWEK